MTTSLTVLVDATSIPPSLGGVGRYLQHLIPELAALPDLDVVVACQERDREWISKAAPSARVVVPAGWAASRAGRLLWEQLGLPRLARRVGAQVIHAPHYTMPLLSPVPVVVTFHDATFFSHPALHSRLKRVFFRGWSRASSALASAVVVPSIATRDEELRYLPRFRAQIVVAYHGVDAQMFALPTAGALADVARDFDLPESGWLSFLGTIEPRKNIANLVRAYDSLSRERSMPPLVVAGAKGWDEETGAVVAALPAGTDVRLVGYVPAEQLAALLGGSTIFVYPSLGEGFGLPVLEAMASGAPTLTTRELALPEVGGDAVAYTGTSWQEIAVAIAALLDDDEMRGRMRQAGLARASEFTWKRSAIAHREAYAAAASGRTRRVN